MAPKVNVNLNLQKSNNYMVILKGDELLNTKDVTFYIKNFKVPNMKISPATVDTLPNVIYYPSQGRMDYDPLTLDVLVDDNLNSYMELAKWLNRIKNPEVLLQSHTEGFNPLTYKRSQASIVKTIDSTKQHPIEYRDLDIIITDRNHQNAFRFNFVDAWVSDVNGLELDAQKSEYLTFSTTFYYLYMRIFDMNDNQIIPPLDFPTLIETT